MGPGHGCRMLAKNEALHLAASTSPAMIGKAERDQARREAGALGQYTMQSNFSITARSASAVVLVSFAMEGA